MKEKNIFFISKSSNCGVVLFDKKTGCQLEKIPFTEDERMGNTFRKKLKLSKPGNVTYMFYEGDRLLADVRARCFCSKYKYGQKRELEDFRAIFPDESFDWEGDVYPHIPYKDVLAYCLHVRGFTMDSSSGVKYRGTFKGITEKIPYLKEIGVTTLELQPAYEFVEMSSNNRLNYWGYTRGFYYSPKMAYAASDNPVKEFKELVKLLHKNGLELIMQFYFPKEVKALEIADILHFWVQEYHVDGFHLMGENIPAEMLAVDDMLAACKLWYYHFDAERIYGRGEQCSFPHLAEYNDSWYYDMRRFLKGDENMLEAVMYHMRHIPSKMGHIHYISNYFGFTLADLVAYDYKHNEENGENNRDGSDNNCSWNCGEEGPTRKEAVKRMREQQIKNAMCMLLFAQSSPLIFMGDEFGNTQNGNNNPYCQDNEITWLNWDLQKKNAPIFEFWKQLVEFRNNNPILHPECELKQMDYQGVGCPDLSFHGKEAWRPRTENYFRQLGIMLCGKYAGCKKDGEDKNLYIAMNMYWEPCEMGLPKAPVGTTWRKVLSTAEAVCEKKAETIAPRSIAVYMAL